MAYAPILPFSGYAGWQFLTRTADTQKAAFDKNPVTERDTAHFRDKIAGVKTAADLVADRRLLGVALGAFGLEADINNRYFIRKVLEDGTFNASALGNRLADKRYLDMAKAFGFGDFSVPNTVLSTFPDKIIARYRDHQFEAAVGEVDTNQRLALNARRELAALAAKPGSEDTLWYTAMGSGPLRQVLQTALALPSQFSGIDLDQQLSTLRDRSDRLLGSPSIRQFSDPARVEDVIRMFLLRADSAPTPARGSGALQLLQSGQSGGGSILSLLL